MRVVGGRGIMRVVGGRGIMRVVGRRGIMRVVGGRGIVCVVGGRGLMRVVGASCLWLLGGTLRSCNDHFCVRYSEKFGITRFVLHNDIHKVHYNYSWFCCEVLA